MMLSHKRVAKARVYNLAIAFAITYSACEKQTALAIKMPHLASCKTCTSGHVRYIIPYQNLIKRLRYAGNCRNNLNS